MFGRENGGCVAFVRNGPGDIRQGAVGDDGILHPRIGHFVIDDALVLDAGIEHALVLNPGVDDVVVLDPGILNARIEDGRGVGVALISQVIIPDLRRAHIGIMGFFPELLEGIVGIAQRKVGRVGVQDNVADELETFESVDRHRSQSSRRSVEVDRAGHGGIGLNADLDAVVVNELVEGGVHAADLKDGEDPGSSRIR